MTLEDWLKQDRNLADQLKVMEGLCSALNEGTRGDRCTVASSPPTSRWTATARPT